MQKGKSVIRVRGCAMLKMSTLAIISRIRTILELLAIQSSEIVMLVFRQKRHALPEKI